VSWVEEGEVRYQVGRERLVAPVGVVVLVPAGREHLTGFPSRLRAGALWVAPELVNAIAGEVGASTLAPASTEDLEVAALGRLLGDELARRAPGYLLAAEALVEAILVRALRSAPSRPALRARGHRGVAAAVDLIESSYADDLDLAELARVAGLTRWHFGRLFRAQVGRSPYRYLTDVRLDRAAELLARGRRGVTEAALEVGFRDLGRFARAFRARHGLAPSALVARARRARGYSQ
jgi:AraC family transcriptional regulator